MLLAFFATFVALAFADGLRPARVFVPVPLWRIKGLVFFVVTFVISSFLPLAYADWLAAHSVIDASGLGIGLGTVVGILLSQLASYWWHRALHRFEFLWRWHQMHHSAERVDVYGALYLHPFDAVGFTLASSLGLLLIAGLPAESVVLANGLISLCQLFQHANRKTPRLLGYIVQRPENHAIHHERGVHAHNYGDIALWDIVFGTFKNPSTWHKRAGFYDGASRRIVALLAGRDVTRAAS